MPLDRSNCVATYKILVLGDASVGKTALLRRLMGREFQDRLYPTGSIALNTGSTGFYHFWTELSAAVQIPATDFVRKRFEVDGALIELQIWDTAGQERFRSVTRWQFRGVKGVAMIYDITNKDTFTHLSYWLQCVNQEISHCHNKYEAIPIVLLGNKADLEDKRQVRLKEGIKEISHCHNKYEAIPIVLLGNKADLEDKRQVRLKEGIKLADKEMAFAFHETSAKTGQNVFNAFRKLAYDVAKTVPTFCSILKKYQSLRPQEFQYN